MSDSPTPVVEQPSTPPSRGQTARDFGLVITNLTKFGGLVIAVNESLIRVDLRPIAMGVAALMMAGATGLETFLDKLFGR